MNPYTTMMLCLLRDNYINLTENDDFITKYSKIINVIKQSDMYNEQFNEISKNICISLNLTIIQMHTIFLMQINN